MEETRSLRFRLNGVDVAGTVPVRRNLVDALRHDFGHTGSHVGCEHGCLRRLHNCPRRRHRPGAA